VNVIQHSPDVYRLGIESVRPQRIPYFVETPNVRWELNHGHQLALLLAVGMYIDDFGIMKDLRVNRKLDASERFQ
jgi:hypothetical protein